MESDIGLEKLFDLPLYVTIIDQPSLIKPLTVLVGPECETCIRLRHLCLPLCVHGFLTSHTDTEFR